MTFTWTPHRFSGGALALDVANSVVLRHLPERRVDRLADAPSLAALAEAASRHSAEREIFGSLEAVSPDDAPDLVLLREAIDAYFRTRVEGRDDAVLLADLLEKIAAALRSRPARGDLIASTARSALGLLSGPAPDRMKICGNCGWLFLDRSKNRSRSWCDMAVCGNRRKASRHYAAQRGKTEGEPGA